MKITFWGSSHFSAVVLAELHQKAMEGKLELLCVITQPAKPTGRNQELTMNPVGEYCTEHGIKMLTPNKLNEDFLDSLPDADLAFVAAYGKLLKENILQSTEYGFLNFHGSVLPKYRGAVPVQMTILNQEESSGVTIQKMGTGMDDGPILCAREFAVEPNSTTGELMEKLAHLSATMIDSEFGYIFSPENWNLEAQDESQATYCYLKDFTKETVQISYDDGITKAHGKIMSANPDPKAWAPHIEMKGKTNQVNFIRSDITTKILHSPAFERKGQLALHKINKKLYLELRDGYLEILQIQPQGKGVLAAAQFLSGYLNR